MSIELVKAEIMRFLSSNEPEVLCITGKWGVGKTWSWKHFLEDAWTEENGIALKRYAYVSLFGISSLDDLKHSIFENTVPKEKIESGANSETFQLMLESPEVLGRKSAYGLTNWLIKLTKIIPYLKYLDFGGAHRVFSLFIRKQIICIDDLDRKGKNLEVSDVFGLISFLREERDCKIALILNEDALPEDQKGDYHKYLEKVVDVSLKFKPTSEESIQIALSKRGNATLLIADNCKKLDISNIRIIKKIENLVRKITPLLEKFDEEILRQAIHSLTLLAWSFHAPEIAPTVDYLKKRTGFNLDLSEKKTISEKEGAWNALLDAYIFSSMDEFDYLLLHGVENGFFDHEAIKQEAWKVDEQIRARKSTESFWKTLEIYHDSFDDNQEEVIDRIYKAFKKNVQHISFNDLNGTVELFKKLEMPEKAKEIIKYYIENRKGDSRFWNLDYYGGIYKIDDTDVLAAIKIKCASFKEDIEANELLLKMTENRGWDNEQNRIKASKLPVKEYNRIFKSQKGDKLHSIIKFCLQFDNISNASPEMREISKRAKNALKSIGKESNINALRISRYIGKIDSESN